MQAWVMQLQRSSKCKSPWHCVAASVGRTMPKLDAATHPEFRHNHVVCRDADLVKDRAEDTSILKDPDLVAASNTAVAVNPPEAKVGCPAGCEQQDTEHAKLSSADCAVSLLIVLVPSRWVDVADQDAGRVPAEQEQVTQHP